jgi:FKBP-type peptidyl-prolyl cis-trans isomerase
MRIVSPAIVAGMLCFWAAGCQRPEIEISRETPVVVVQDRSGSGPVAKTGREVTINYTVTTPDGRELMRGRKYAFKLGYGAVISGIDTGVDGMRVGGSRTVRCPPSKHWGDKAYANIPANTTLLIRLELLEVN